jgi:hypothetical protein
MLTDLRAAPGGLKINLLLFGKELPDIKRARETVYFKLKSDLRAPVQRIDIVGPDNVFGKINTAGQPPHADDSFR